MAKSKSFFGLRTGSTKSLTFQTYRGQQITKDRVTSVSNPQSTAQMDQRLLLPMVANARTRLAGLVDHSFEGVPYGYQSLQKFSSMNLQKGALTVSSYVPKGLSDPGRANFIISDGSLHSPLDEPALIDDDSTLLFSAGVLKASETKISLPAMPAGTKGSTVMYYLNRYMMADDRFAWFSSNSQLTFLGQGTKNSVKYTATDGTEKDYPLSGFAIMRLVNPAAYPAETKAGTALTVDELKDYHDDNDKFVLAEAVAAGGTNIVVLKSVVADLGIEIGIFQTSEASEGGSATYELGFSPYFNAVQEGDFALACACIFSQLDGSVWRRSRTRLTVIDFSRLATREDVIGGYLKSGSESTKYLNTGTEGTGIVGSKKA